MSKDNEWNDECFYCDSCGKAFRSPLYDVTKEFEYTTFYDSPRIPEVEIMGAEVIANYCSITCREKHRNQILKREKIQATFPDIGPTETCSRCNGPVLMTSFHLAFVEMDTEQNWGQPIFGANVINSQVISVVCTKCEPIPFKISRAIDWDS
jgi:hypothetical protein